MLNFKKSISTFSTCLIMCSMFVLPSAQAALITIAAADPINVSVDGDANSAGTVNSGSLSGNDVITRERANLSQTDMRIASFIEFDLGSLTADIVNSSFFSASFEADFAARLNTVNNMTVMLGQVGTEWDDTAGSLPLFEWADASTNQSVLLNNAKTAALQTYTVDVTDIVKDWVNGDAKNYGFVVFGSEPVYQGAAFNNVGLQVEVPEPSTLMIFAIAVIGLASRRFQK